MDKTITPLKDTKHLLVSAFMDQRVQGFDIRIIGLFRIDSIQPLHCRFCCAARRRRSIYLNLCITFALRLLGVGRVVIYNTSCGPELERLLQIYSQDGFLEIVPWPIHQHLNPSKGWLFSEHGGDVHYFGQLATLNECIYRSMERSRYILLNDIDEIIMPYQHDNLMSMMNMLQEQHPNAGVFIIENHFFPKKPFEGDKPGPLPQWRGVPGFNIMEHIYREEPDRTKYLPNKLIVKPRAVEQTSVHEVLKQFNETFKVPMEVCRIINCRMIYTKSQLELLHVDTRLWDFSDDLLTSVMKMLRRAGLLSSEVEGRQIG
ncbi:glycosyltransferase family 92 protein F13G3.3-like [Hippoglossus hippoglossus]|uniref:glycosyltransferase family 92 protein F13G3.3-like n=1 Tax=Hippoglossus hippoglossus TaxID=8267 RepID=UPI00148E3132|nr:glycosyltransferase family 92 protein F13G3.3-like [Hippoglossus hippoglossus]